MQWELKQNGYQPSEPIQCPICKTHLMLRWSRINSHEDIAMELFRKGKSKDDAHADLLLEIFDSMEMPSWVEDMAWKCPSCSFWTVFGVPIKAAEAKRIMSGERNGSSVFVPIEQWWGDEIIKNRLKDLGYW